jgi:hypothetical protein
MVEPMLHENQHYQKYRKKHQSGECGLDGCHDEASETKECIQHAGLSGARFL